MWDPNKVNLAEWIQIRFKARGANWCLCASWATSNKESYLNSPAQREVKKWLISSLLLLDISSSLICLVVAPWNNLIFWFLNLILFGPHTLLWAFLSLWIILLRLDYSSGKPLLVSQIQWPLQLPSYFSCTKLSIDFLFI